LTSECPIGRARVKGSSGVGPTAAVRIATIDLEALGRRDDWR
jgi:hypothetical protein